MTAPSPWLLSPFVAGLVALLVAVLLAEFPASGTLTLLTPGALAAPPAHPAVRAWYRLTPTLGVVSLGVLSAAVAGLALRRPFARLLAWLFVQAGSPGGSRPFHAFQGRPNLSAAVTRSEVASRYPAFLILTARSARQGIATC